MSRYLSFAEVNGINSEMVRQFGGVYGLRDAGALHAALAQARKVGINVIYWSKQPLSLRAWPRTIPFSMATNEAQ